MAGTGVVLDSERLESDGSKVTDIKVDSDGATIETPQHVGEPGIDALPLDGDFAVYVDDGTGSKSIVGYFDPKLEPKAQKGEIRIISRSALGVVSVELYVRNDGTLAIKGDVTVEGDLTVTGEVTAKSSTLPVTLSGHTHPTGVGPSGPPQG